MNREDIIRVAREAGLSLTWISEYGLRLAALVAAHEREACARVCERAAETIWRGHETSVIEAGTNVCNNVAAAIRARGEEPNRHPGYIIGDHWLQAAYTRVCTGETEVEVMADYGWQRESR